MNPKLSILITSYRNPAVLRLCIRSIRKYVKNLEYEIIVADGETKEETYDLMREEFSRITFLPNKKNVGFGKLVNQCLNKAKGDYYFVINSDIVVKEGSVEKLIDYLERNPQVGIVGPQLINFDNSIQQSCFRFYSPMTIVYRRTFLGNLSFAKKHLDRFMMKDKQKQVDKIETDWIMGSAMMTSRKAAKKVGRFDERYFMYFEDVDWCWRFWKNDFEVVYCPNVKVFHYHGKQSKSKNAVSSVLFNKYSRIHIKSAIKFFIKHLGESDPHKLYDQNKQKEDVRE